MSEQISNQPTAHEPTTAENDVGAATLNQIEDLTWGMLDENLTEKQFLQLEGLLQTNDAARETYVHCVQLHVDLMSHFAPAPAPKPVAPALAAKSPVLGFLNAGEPPLGVQQPDTK